jgi:hypothetical protein
LLGFWKNISKYKWVARNILIVDHFEVTEVVNVALQMNGISASVF